MSGGQRSLLIVVLLLLLFVLFVGPWPTNHDDYLGQSYSQQTFTRIDQLQPVISGNGKLSAGLSVIDITPPMGVPLAGYSARNPKENVGVRDRVFVKALSIKAGEALVTIVAADYLLPIPQLVDAVVQRSGVERGAIFFTATHTHSGPGGYGEDMVSQYALGNFDPAQFERMVSSFSRAVLESRASMLPVRLSYRQQRLDAPSSQSLMRHALDREIEASATLNLLQLSHLKSKRPFASLVSFPAHPTILGKRNYRVSGDYPAKLQQLLAKQLGGEVLFAVGAVGSTKTPRVDLDREQKLDEVARRIGERYVSLAASKGKPGMSLLALEAPVSSYLLEVDLPVLSVNIADGWRLSTFLSGIIHDQKSQLQLLRIGKLVLVGYPGDLSLDIADRLRDRFEGDGIAFWPTSFNGDYIGYLMPQSHYHFNRYETRRANLLGPWGGDYFDDLTLRLVERAVTPHIE
ncbi:hypothetical protein BOW53_06765 [Solemya pervernicosa gill symbiont]|uniref:Neutral ceramidase n=2 Tax=Gammaproteobacteria incertae sedis TaxID=118884 RepID=A0A1T2L6H3_9GAMM|nr:neutral/alkaline non-lysosomal ceramidase N-terminal domain-containing protein [Candidatus Reidiella endopervernicosa]OOZ40705.1 hypothetical protein BOW53_06765 [Solemya pervernicosa gill symbiont]QKQ26773.1 neutral/alkaline non-lysosomal ceramidase N-terminal domain-containing protein [Candidatus Reidiella endopervernicosa]